MINEQLIAQLINTQSQLDALREQLIADIQDERADEPTTDTLHELSQSVRQMQVQIRDTAGDHVSEVTRNMEAHRRGGD